MRTYRRRGSNFLLLNRIVRALEPHSRVPDSMNCDYYDDLHEFANYTSNSPYAAYFTFPYFRNGAMSHLEEEARLYYAHPYSPSPLSQTFGSHLESLRRAWCCGRDRFNQQCAAHFLTPVLGHRRCCLH